MIHHPILRAILRPPAELYGGMMRLRAELYRRGVLRATRLPGKTISVGNLTVGGTGKTPTTIWLARQLQAAGYRPGILARGYGRRDENELIVLRPAPNQYDSGLGEAAGYPTAVIGDEAILFRRHLPEVPIGLCADRVRAANALAAEFGVNLFLLDDGYQRLDVARDVNLLLVDASAAGSAGRQGMLPVGQLREPESAAARADVILLTRCVGSLRVAAPALSAVEGATSGQAAGSPQEPKHSSETELRKRLRRFTSAPIYHAHTRPAGFIRASDERIVPEDKSAAAVRGRWLAFCGIGNADAFFSDLRRWGLEIAHSVTFRDHHRYWVDDLARLEQEAKRAGATGLITTEKDFINLPPTSGAGPGLPLCYCRIELEPVEPEFWQEILRRLEQVG